MIDSQSNSHPLSLASRALADAIARVAPTVVAIDARRHGSATGVLWRPGVIVTAAHAIRRDDGIRITLADGTQVDAALAGSDKSTDLAVLKLDNAGPAAADIGDAAGVRMGHFVFAVARDGRGSVAADFGIVGATGGEWRTWRGGRIDRLIRLNGALNGGFAGCPIADTEGRVIGIGTPALSRAFAIVIPASTVDRVVDELLANGRVARGYLGIGTRTVVLPESLSAKLGLSGNSGLIVLSLASAGPAEQAGLMVGDIVIGVAGEPVATVDDLQAALGRKSIGEAVSVSLVRGGERLESTITIGERSRRCC